MIDRVQRPSWVQQNRCFAVTASLELHHPRRCLQSAQWLVPEFPYCEKHPSIAGLGLLMERRDDWEAATRSLFHRLTDGVDPATVVLETAGYRARWKAADVEAAQRYQDWRAK